MAVAREYEAALAHLEQEIDGFIGASFVDIETGRTLLAHSVRSEFALDAVGTLAGALIEGHRNGLKALLPFAQPEEMLLTLTDQFHVGRMVSSAVLLYVVASRAETNLALIRAAVNRRAADVCDGNPAPRENAA